LAAAAAAAAAAVVEVEARRDGHEMRPTAVRQLMPMTTRRMRTRTKTTTSRANDAMKLIWIWMLAPMI
jgi:hypothetical protein